MSDSDVIEISSDEAECVDDDDEDNFDEDEFEHWSDASSNSSLGTLHSQSSWEFPPYHVEEKHLPFPSVQPRQLSELSGMAIVNQSPLLKHAMSVSPPHIHEVLLHQAVRLNVRESLEQLISQYPQGTLSAAEWKVNPRLLTAAKGMAHLMRMLVQGLLRLPADTKLQSVDLSKLDMLIMEPEAPSELFKLPLLYLLHKKTTLDSIQNHIAKKTDMCEEDLSQYLAKVTSKVINENAENICSYHKGPLAVHVGCHLVTDNFTTVSSGLALAELTPFKFEIHRLEVIEFDEMKERIPKFLKLVNPNTIKEILFDFETSNPADTRNMIERLIDQPDIVEALKLYPNMEVLQCLSGPTSRTLPAPDAETRMPTTEAACSTLASIFNHWKSLNNLSIVSNTVTGQVETLLSALSTPLHELNLRSCGLGDSDLDYLAKSRHAPGLCTLNLEGNDLSKCIKSLVKLLENTVDLVELGISKCKLSTADLLLIGDSFQKAESLSSACVMMNNFHTKEDILSIIDKFAKIRSLKTLSMGLNFTHLVHSSYDVYETHVREKHCRSDLNLH